MAEPGQSAGTKYLTFVLGGETYGLEAARVDEIVAAVPATPVPGAPECLRGVIDLRGRIIPVLDLRARFALEAAPDTGKSCIVVVRIEGRRTALGLLVDEVLDVLGIDGGRIEPAPAFGAGVDTGCLRGIARAGERVVLLLDADRALSLSTASTGGVGREGERPCSKG